jgi:hypothetical protein
MVGSGDATTDVVGVTRSSSSSRQNEMIDPIALRINSAGQINSQAAHAALAAVVAGYRICVIVSRYLIH